MTRPVFVGAWVSGSFRVERRNPLPVGRYWVLLIGDAPNKAFDRWLGIFTKPGWVKLETTEQISTDPLQQFHIFSVVRPPTQDFDPLVIWDAKTLGFPSEAPASVQSHADVEQAPTPESDGGFNFGSLFEGLSGFSGLALLVGLYLLSKR